MELQFADIFDRVNAYAAGAPIDVVNPEVLASTADSRRLAPEFSSLRRYRQS